MAEQFVRAIYQVNVHNGLPTNFVFFLFHSRQPTV